MDQTYSPGRVAKGQPAQLAFFRRVRLCPFALSVKRAVASRPFRASNEKGPALLRSPFVLLARRSKAASSVGPLARRPGFAVSGLAAL